MKANSNNWRAHTKLRDKVSLGVACCRFANGKPEILLIRKRFTYAFNSFGHGRYNSNSNSELIALFNGMTADEKHDILSLNFVQIWYRIWLSNAPVDSFMPAKLKYENSFLLDGGERLRHLIKRSTNAEPIWEIPKGKKKNKNELDIHCAIREFGEETGLAKRHYRIFPLATRTYSYVDNNVNYINTYYLAFAPRGNIHFGFSHPDQMDEVSDIKWMNIENVRLVDSSRRLSNFVKPIFRFMKKNIK